MHAHSNNYVEQKQQLNISNYFCCIVTVPAGDTCKPLNPIDHGGIIYSDLILSPGVIANYVCEDGYSVHGNPSRTCGTDGNWIGSESDDPVCEGME